MTITPTVTPPQPHGRQCACPEHADRVDCIDLRYSGYAPGPNSARYREDREECECACHDGSRSGRSGELCGDGEDE